MSIADYSPDLILFCGAFIVDVLFFFADYTHFWCIDSFKPKRQNALSANGPEQKLLLNAM